MSKTKAQLITENADLALFIKGIEGKLAQSQSVLARCMQNNAENNKAIKRLEQYWELLTQSHERQSDEFARVLSACKRRIKKLER